MLKKITAIILMTVSLLMPFGAEAVNDITPTAKSAVILDAASGAVLYSKNMNERLGMASTTKIMTGILALEHGSLSDVYKVPEDDYWVEGSSLYLNPGENVSLETLVYGLLLKSGNDAALAIARHVSGSEKAFVALMNEKAKELGLENTKFANPHGLYAEDHYTTAFELARLAAYAMQNPVFAEIVKTAYHKETPVDEERNGRMIKNANKLISLYAEADGVKPGFTPETGRTLVGSATKDGIKVITVTLDCENDWEEHKNMFDYAFNNFKRITLLKKGDSVGTFRIKKGNYHEVGAVIDRDVTLLVNKNETPEYEVKMEAEPLTAPIVSGQYIGKAKICFADGIEHNVNVLANSDVPLRDKNFFRIIGRLFLALFGLD